MENIASNACRHTKGCDINRIGDGGVPCLLTIDIKCDDIAVGDALREGNRIHGACDETRPWKVLHGGDIGIFINL